MITIKIGDAFQKAVEETHEFSQRDEAQKFLLSRVPQLSRSQTDEIFSHPDTQFELPQFRNYPEQDAALSMMVRYEITVTE